MQKNTKNIMIDAYKGREGLITYCVSGSDKKWIQNWANDTNELYGYKEQYGNTLNNYISMAVYNAKHRTPLHVKEMVWLFVCFQNNFIETYPDIVFNFPPVLHKVLHI